MRNIAMSLLLATASLASLSTSALAQATNDVDAIEQRDRIRENAQQRRNEQNQAQPEQQQQRVEPPAQRDNGNAEVRQDRGGFERRANQQSGNADVAPNNRRFNRSGNDDVFNNRRVEGGNVEVRRNDGRGNDRRLEQSDGQRFGRNEEYRSDRDESRRLSQNDYRRRGEIGRDSNWYRDSNDGWQRRNGRGLIYRGDRGHDNYDARNYGNRDGRDYSYGGNDQRWNRDWRRDSRYNWERYRLSNRSFYRLSPYYDPFGSRYGYQRFSIGVRIGSGYYSNRYWISDPYAYRLPNVDGPYHWVRYYNDVLLIDVRNGYVVDMIYDFFW